jgi:hypothetical protein
MKIDEMASASDRPVVRRLKSRLERQEVRLRGLRAGQEDDEELEAGGGV